VALVGSETLAARVARGFANAGVAFNHEAVSKMIRKELQELRPAPSPALDCRVLCVQAAAFSLGGDAGRKLPEHLGQPAWAMCCNRLAPMRLVPFSYFCTCWNAVPRASPRSASVIRSSRTWRSGSYPWGCEGSAAFR